jgi:hypothetical protein
VARKHIDSKEASVAATFYEPAYQRLRQWHNGQMIDLLGFVNPTSKAVQGVLAHYGAGPSRSFRAKCFAEVWELPHDIIQTRPLGTSPAKFDKEICDAIGCCGNKLSAASGFLWWDDNKECEYQRRHVPSGFSRILLPAAAADLNQD